MGDQETTGEERDRPKGGRRARREGTVDAIVGALPPSLQGRGPFPEGSLHYGADPRLTSIVVDFGGGWDKDVIAAAYRKEMGGRLENLTGAALYKSWEGFSKYFVPHRDVGEE